MDERGERIEQERNIITILQIAVGVAVLAAISWINVNNPIIITTLSLLFCGRCFRDLTNAEAITTETVHQMQDLNSQLIDSKRQLRELASENARLKDLLEDALDLDESLRKNELRKGGEYEESRNECPICLSIITHLKTSSCGHEFCVGCLNEWLQTSSLCPICRREINMQPYLCAIQ